MPGKFLNATLDKASKDNERQLLAMKTASGKEIVFVQIAGLIARRILCFAKPGDKYKAGERFGLIRFGSRLDVYLPAGVEPQVWRRSDHDRRRNRDRQSFVVCRRG